MALSGAAASPVFGGGRRVTMASSSSSMPSPGLAGGEDGARGVETDHLLDLRLDPLGLGRRQVDLVQHRHDLEIVVERLVDVGQGLRLDTLGGVHHQQRPFARRQAAGDLVGEIDVPRRVHQVEDVILAVPGPVIEPHGLRLDGDAALALDLHRVQNLLGHLPSGEPPGRLDQPVRERRFAVVDVRHDGEIADAVAGGHGAVGISARAQGQARALVGGIARNQAGSGAQKITFGPFVTH
jgi:hypothetical protein